MANISRSFVSAPNKTLTLFPHSVYGLDLADWGTYSKSSTQQDAPNLGRYDTVLDDTYRLWMIFEGSAQPTDWDKWIGKYDIDELIITESDWARETGDILRLMSGGTVVFSQAPVTPQGKISGPIIIGDDYFDERAFVWYIDPEPGLIADYRVFFGGKSYSNVGQWLVEGVITAVTIDGEPKWELRHELLSADSSLLKAGSYIFAVTLIKDNLQRITRAFGSVDAVKVFTVPIPDP